MVSRVHVHASRRSTFVVGFLPRDKGSRLVHGARTRTQLHSQFFAVAKKTPSQMVVHYCVFSNVLFLKMSTTWNDELELKFIESFQSKPILWQSKHKDHKRQRQSR
ncbi:hypothetical protein PYW07_004063 [Mythimna separata]|uniref:Uncharacterized protein n=1 Tax=Mythimna separata TaxID=271217 RepID=A0AAD7YPP3_MYTSE|nr:hypothetical protein PYW07_004063 [Mythimna separata]